jgi:hypothetical protein
VLHFSYSMVEANWEQRLEGIGYRLDMQLTSFAHQTSASGYFFRLGLVFQNMESTILTLAFLPADALEILFSN